MDSRPTVFVVDDDPAVLRFITFLVKSNGRAVESFSSAKEFLDRYDPERPGCLLLDVRMPGMGGLELQECLARRNIEIPIIVMTAHSDVPIAVRALKAGALDFLEKPLDGDTLLDRIDQAFAQDAAIRENRQERQRLLARVSTLTQRELEIMQLTVAGSLNDKEIAARLNISPKTLSAHRRRILKNMQCRSFVELAEKVRLASEESERTSPGSSSF